MIEYLGWGATAVFVASYLCTRADALRRVQMGGALLWVAYGLLIEAYPVVGANLLVFGAAAWTMTRSTTRQGRMGHANVEYRSEPHDRAALIVRRPELQFGRNSSYLDPNFTPGGTPGSGQAEPYR